jgi:hypothetical protein
MYAAAQLNITITNEREVFETVDAHRASRYTTRPWLIHLNGRATLKAERLRGLVGLETIRATEAAP